MLNSNSSAEKCFLVSNRDQFLYNFKLCTLKSVVLALHSRLESIFSFPVSILYVSMSSLLNFLRSNHNQVNDTQKQEAQLLLNEPIVLLSFKSYTKCSKSGLKVKSRK